MYILGITGGIATGKSTVTQMLADLGAPTLSADAIARDLSAPGTATTQAVLTAFPEAADSSGEAIDRRALGRIVFGDPQARARLEALTHPAIIAAIRVQIAQWRTSKEARAAVAEIPLLYEAGLEKAVDATVVVACNDRLQIERLRERLNSDEAEAERLIAAQWPMEEKIVRAEYVITTDFGLDQTRDHVEALWNSLGHTKL